MGNQHNLPSALPEVFPEVLKERLDPVCVAVQASDPASLFRHAAAALAESRFLELRFDGLAQPGAALEPLREFRKAHPQATVLATCRRRAGGGGFRGTAGEQMELLLACAAAGATLVDLEGETLAEVSPEQLLLFADALTRNGAWLLVSAHDFTGPGDPERVLGDLRRLASPCRPAIYKVVSTARCLADNLRMLAFLESRRAVGLVGLSMGMAGLPSRVLGLRAGAVFTFASATGGEATAEGQLPARALLQTYRAPALGPQTRVYGVAGNPVAHSLSPVLHNAAFRAAGLDAVYLPLHTTSMGDLLELVAGLPLAGLSVTMPWKIEIARHLHTLDPLAAAIGAVNTVVRGPDGALWGTNTDADTITELLEERIALHGARVLLLGAGGAARAAAFALRSRGAGVWILNRTQSAAQELARASGAELADRTRLGGFDAVVQATPAGMRGDAAEAVSLLDAEALAGVRVVLEMVYHPPETPLTRLASSLGIAVISGLAMFTHQGARQWELWTGQKAPLSVMREALQEALGHSTGIGRTSEPAEPEHEHEHEQGRIGDGKV